MPSNTARTVRPLSRLPLAALAATIVVVAFPAVATAAPGGGGVTLKLGGAGKAADSLADAGVRTAAIAPAKKRGKRIVLPVQSLTVGKSASVSLRGGIAFELRKRSLKLRSLKLTLSARQATITAKSGTRRLAAFSASLPKGKAKLDASGTTAKLAGAKLRLTRKGAKLLRVKLAADVLAGSLGRLTVDAKPGRAGGGNGGGGPGAGAPKSGPIENEPPVMARPPSAVDVSDIAIAWYPRDSWVRYVTTGTVNAPQNGFFASGGATKGAPSTSASHPCSDAAYGGTPSDTFDFTYHYAPKSGWYDPPTQTAAIYGQGSVRFSWQTHGIDLIASDPEIELNPSNPRTIFRFSGSGGTAYPNQRAALTGLDLAGQPTVAGDTRTYTAARGRLTEDGQAVFAGFYPPPNDEFGCVTVSFTT